jgi:hypothetical protein
MFKEKEKKFMNNFGVLYVNKGLFSLGLLSVI